jgi:tetratricopeptide (TPR) repeat protein
MINRQKESRALNSLVKAWVDHPDPMVQLWQLTGTRGAGRTRFLSAFKESLSKETHQWTFSFLEGPIFSQLSDALNQVGEKEDLSFEEISSHWIDKIRSLPEEALIAINFEDLQEIENIERPHFENLIKSLQSLSRKILIGLEYQGENHSLPISLVSDSSKTISLGPLDKNSVKEWLQRVTGKKRLPRGWVKALMDRSDGNPQRLVLWLNLLELSKFPPDWPLEESGLIAEWKTHLSLEEVAILVVMALHSSWVSLPFIKSVTNHSEKKLKSYLEIFHERGWVRQSHLFGDRWLLRWNTLGSTLAQELNQDERNGIHQRCYQFLKQAGRWFFKSNWLAYHASQGELNLEAFAGNLKVAELYSLQKNWSTAEAYAFRSQDFATGDFQRSYAKYMTGEILTAGGKFSSAMECFNEGLKLAEQVNWPELIQENALKVGELLSHLGRYAEVEPFYKKGLKVMEARGLREDWVRIYQSLGISFLEQARYFEAEEIFQEVLKIKQDSQDLLGMLNANISLAQVGIALGRGTFAMNLLEKVQTDIPSNLKFMWEPILQLLFAKLHLSQGNQTNAMRLLGESAKGFEENGDMNGKVEVLLVMSASLLENNLIEEAQELISYLASWKEFDLIPSLKHSMRLRRLAIAAFSGKLVGEDLVLFRQDTERIGRTEDWLQFWFHLSLAGQKRKDKKFYHEFIGKARSLAEKVAGREKESDRETFLKRADIARIFRLSAEGEDRGEAKIKGERKLDMEGPAAAADLAPPVRGKKDDDD